MGSVANGSACKMAKEREGVDLEEKTRPMPQ